MNIQNLYLAIEENRNLIKDSSLSLDINKKDLSTQKEVLDFLCENGIVEINFYTPEKTTEEPFAHFCLVKGGLEVNIGMLKFPSVRKAKQKRGWDYIISEFAKDILAPQPSENLSRENGSMLLYVLQKKTKLDEYKLINGYAYRKVKLPTQYDSVEKVMSHVNVEKLEKFKVA